MTDLRAVDVRLANSVTSVLRAAVAGETGIVGIAGLAIGIPTGAIVGATLLAILAGVFDPPADLPVFPLLGIALVAATAAAGLVAASVVGSRAAGRIDVMRGLRER